MAFEFPIDDLGVINSALAMTGDNAVVQAGDGSDEWDICSPAYQRGLGYAMESHGWGFATQVKALTPSPTPPQDNDFDTAYPIPTDCVHIIWVKLQDGPAWPPPASPPYPNAPPGGWDRRNQRLALYNILGTQTGPVIVINALRSWPGWPATPSPEGWPGEGRGVVTLKYISNSGVLTDSTSGTPTLILALQSFVMSGIYRGLHEDPAEADKLWMAGEHMLQMARTRHDQQLPKRAFFNSRMAASRRVRRPWPPVSIDSWGGSNTPA